jgi:hypothetical protein
VRRPNIPILTDESHETKNRVEVTIVPLRTSSRNYIILVGSLLTGLFVDALAERIVGQDYYQGSTSRNAGHARPVQDDGNRPQESVTISGLENLTKPLAAIQVTPGVIREKMPEDSWSLSSIAGQCNYPGTFQERLAAWEAPNVGWYPLYFEDVALERYGYTAGPFVQPVRSAAFFGASLLMLPVNLVRENPFQCDTPLGYCRPGSAAPYVAPRWLLR